MHVGTVYSTGTSVALPAHQPGDLIVISAIRWGSSTIPALPAGFTSLIASSSSHGRRLGYKIATSSSETSGTWTSAIVVVASVYRGLSPGAVATSTSQIPGLTLQSPPSWVWEHHGWVSAAWRPSGWTQRAGWPDEVVSDSDGPLASWAGASSGSGTDYAFALELIPQTTQVTNAWAIASDQMSQVTNAWQISSDQEVDSVTNAWQISSDQMSTVAASWQISSDQEAFGADLTRTGLWQQAVAARQRVISARAELVTPDGTPVPVTDDQGRIRPDLPLASASVSFRGEQREQWSASFKFTAPWLVPTTPNHPLWGLQNLRVRLWWRILVDGLWLETVLCTVIPTDPDTLDTGVLATGMDGRDPLAAAVGGYAGPLDISGLTLDAAIVQIFARVAPTLRLQVAPTTVTAAANHVLGVSDRTPADDWTELAAAAWPDGVVRTNREGIIVAGPRPQPSGPLDWQEGPDCVISEIRRTLKTSGMGNRQTVISRSVDGVGVYATVEDDDPSSPTYVGGAWGVHPLPDISTDLETEEACRNLARMHLGRGLYPTEQITVTVPQRPDLDYRRPVQLARQQLGVAGVYEVSGWDLEVPAVGVAPGAMTVTMMTRTVR